MELRKINMKIIIYISSEYSKAPDPLQAALRQIKVAHILLKHGIGFEAPLMGHYINEQYYHKYDIWMKLAIEKLSRSDAILRLPDKYGMSSGAESEVDEAQKLGKPIFHVLRNCIDWAISEELAKVNVLIHEKT